MDRNAGQPGQPEQPVSRCVPCPGRSGQGGWRPVIDYSGRTYTTGCPHRGHRHAGHLQAARCASAIARRFTIALRHGTIDADGIVIRDGAPVFTPDPITDPITDTDAGTDVPQEGQ